ncbi:MAG TPA: hypothetical protein VMW62_08435 [Chloroflexota bacterium]|nr:hypothetical protein [Chloroflexota bacterium]
MALLALLTLTPASAFAQASAPASPGQGVTTGSALPGQAVGANQPPAGASGAPSAAGSGAPSTGEASAAAAGSPAAVAAAQSPAASAPAASAPAASAPAVRGLPTPVGGNAPKEAQEPVPLFAYLLIALGIIWFFAAIAGIARLLSRPRGVAYTAGVPPLEQDRPYLSFIMPFVALISVGLIVTAWGLIFLQTSHISEVYPLAIDLFVVCLVMLIATVASLRGGRPPQIEVH